MDFGHITIILLLTVLYLLGFASFLIFIWGGEFLEQSPKYISVIVCMGVWIGTTVVIAYGFNDLLPFGGSYDEDGHYESLGTTLGLSIGAYAGMYLMMSVDKNRHNKEHIARLKQENKELLNENKKLQKTQKREDST